MLLDTLSTASAQQGDALLPFVFSLGPHRALQIVWRRLQSQERLFPFLDDACAVQMKTSVCCFGELASANLFLVVACFFDYDRRQQSARSQGTRPPSDQWFPVQSVKMALHCVPTVALTFVISTMVNKGFIWWRIIHSEEHPKEWMWEQGRLTNPCVCECQQVGQHVADRKFNIPNHGLLHHTHSPTIHGMALRFARRQLRHFEESNKGRRIVERGLLGSET